MRLRCQKAALLVAVAIISCTGPSEPSSISAHFVLTDVDGFALPATNDTHSQTVVSGTLSLDQGGGAVISEDLLDAAGMHYLRNLGYSYTISNSKIIFDLGCPPDADCAPPPTGQILDNGLRVQLSYAAGHVFQKYNYRVSNP